MTPKLWISVLAVLGLCQLCRSANCNNGQYLCNNGRCINRNHVCDGDNDCNDGSDEDICVAGVCNNPALFKCKDGSKCISVMKVCSGGSSHCSDASDEMDCGTSTCDHPALFKCSDGLCIAKKFVCDGTENCYDGSDENICGTGIVSLSGVNVTRSRGIYWLKSIRNNRWGWEENTHRAIAALYLSGGATFNGTKEEEELMAKQLELKIALALLRNETIPLSANQLALYINALLVTCHNPRNFYGFDTVTMLKLMIENQENQTHPVVYLALCNANETISSKGVRYLLTLLDYESEYLFWTDIQAMAVIALSCITSQGQYAHLAPNITATVNNFKLQQRTDGSFGNIYTSALVVQALLATGNQNEKDWDLEGAIKFLLSKGKSDHSFGDFLATYLVLPILMNKNLADIAQVKCINLRRQPRDRNSILHPRNHNGPFVYILYSLYIGDDMKVIHPISLKVPLNITVLDVMNLAVLSDPKYKYESKVSSHGVYIYSIAGTANDPEAGMFWLLYLGGINSKDGNLRRESPDKIFIKGGEHIIMWYKTAYIYP